MNFQQVILRVLWLVICLPLFVVLLPQAIYVKRTTLRLPEAAGKRFKPSEDEQSIKLLHVGESTVAGVGVETIASGFTANISKALATTLNTPSSWFAFGENGIRIQGLNQALPVALNHLASPASYDLSIVTMGVNDSTKFTSVKQWRASLQQTVNLLQPITQGAIYFTQVPPLNQFPALPSPLKQLLGIRSTILDNELKAFCNSKQGVYYLGSKLKVEKEMMAKDGYHPSELGYQHWAQQIADQIKNIQP